MENLNTIDSHNEKTKHPQWNTLKNLKKNTVVDIKPFARARSLNSNNDVSKAIKIDPIPEDMPKTKFYLNKIANLFKKNKIEKNASPKNPNRRSSRSMTTNKIFPGMKEDPLDTVDDENEDEIN